MTTRTDDMASHVSVPSSKKFNPSLGRRTSSRGDARNQSWGLSTKSWPTEVRRGMPARVERTDMEVMAQAFAIAVVPSKGSST
jgi:hypothetical protein